MTHLSLTKCRIIEELVEIILNQFESMMQESTSLPIPVISIAEDLFGLRLDYEHFRGRLEHASGFFALGRNQIIVNKDDDIRRIYFTISHELAHYLIDDTTREYEKIQGIGAYLPFLQFDHEKERESIANYFAAALLIPKRELIKVLNKRPWLSSNDLPELADLFCTSVTTLRIRLEDLRDDISQFGTQLQLYSSVEKLSNSNNIRNERKNLKDCIVDIDYDYIDYHLIRKLKELRAHSKEIYIFCNEANIDCVESLLDFSIMDGVLLSKQTFLGSNSNNAKEINRKYVKIIKDKWIRWMRERQIFTESEPLSILTRSKDICCNQSQQYLIRLDSIIKPLNLLHGRSEALNFIRQQKKLGKRVVIVTGCFDLITNVHIKFLKRAKAHGDVLVVGIEDDNRVKAFKGPSRPINFIHQRVEVIEALGGIVDFAFVIRGSTKGSIKRFYTTLHCTLKPNILAVSEGDPYLNDRKDEIEAAGGALVTVSKFEEGSTTSLLRKALAELSDLNEYLEINKRILIREAPAEKWTQLSLFS